MSLPDESASDADDPRLMAALREYMAGLDSGRRVNRRELIARHPDIAAELSACLQGLSFVHNAAARLSGDGPAPPPAQPVNDPVALPLGDYRLTREIGRGGMGVVYEAEQLSLGRRVAVKVLPMAAALDPRRLQRFRNEAQAAAGLHHGHIVPVYAVGCDRSTHFYAMQLIDGRTLAEVIRELRAADGGGGRRRAAVARKLLDRPDPSALSVPSGTVAPQPTVPDRTEALPGAPWAQDDLPHVPSAASGTGGASTVSPSTAWSGPRATDTLSSLHGTGRRAAYFRTVAQLGIQAAEALHYAHNLGIIHRDIKPANLMVDGTGHLWVTDFGLAQMYGDNGLTQTGDFVGTFRYMSPEQAGGRPGRLGTGRRHRRTADELLTRDGSDNTDDASGDAPVVLDPRTDVYSLGVTLYELLTLQPALPGRTRDDLMVQLAAVDPKPPRAIDRAVPVELQTVLAKAYAKDPADRYPSAQAFADDLRRFLADEPIHARPPTVWDRAAKWTRRHKSLALATIVVLTLAAAGLGATTLIVSAEQLRATRGEADARHQAVLANEARQLAESLRQQADAARDLAEGGYQQARATVDTLATVATDELPNNPQTAAVRRRMLETVVAYYKQFLAAHGQGGPAAAAADLERAQERWTRAYAELVATDDRYRAAFDVRLLGHADVQQDLSLSAQQVADAHRLIRQVGPPGGGGGPPGANRDGAASPSTPSATQLRASLGDLLDGDRLARLAQISRQLRGVLAFNDAEVQRALALSASQADQLRKIQSTAAGPGGPHHGFGDNHRPPDENDFAPDDVGPRDAGPRAAGGRDARAVRQVLALLTPPQQTAWRRLTGRTFQLTGGGPSDGGGGGPDDLNFDFGGGGGGHRHR